jgi:D-arabinose 1-dehydrogenase-like Zn-dependent alcohol dehydrogenase
MPVPATMRAQRFYKATREWAVEDVPIPEPGPGEVLVKVEYCGICHSDTRGRRR